MPERKRSAGAEGLFCVAILHGNNRQKIDEEDSLENKNCQTFLVYIEYITSCDIIFCVDLRRI
jgi:hypothetical protein